MFQSQIEDVLKELEAIKNWALQNLTERELEYMQERIKNLIESIPEAFDKDDTVLYIY